MTRDPKETTTVMKSKFLCQLLALLLLSCGFAALDSNAAFGQSQIWRNRNPRFVNPYGGTQGRNVGDLVTILVDETSDIRNQDRRGMSKSTANGGNVDMGYGGSGASGSASANFSSDSNRSFDGDTNFESARRFSDRFTVPVLDRLPNGNLIVGGKRRIIVEGEERILLVSGIVRDLDISDNNTVSSKSVSNLDIRYRATGTEPKFNRQGWLGRQVNRAWPF